jgi:hypothetical protein
MIMVPGIWNGAGFDLKFPIMNIQLLTKDDLLQFKSELLAEIKKMVSTQKNVPVYYKSKEVKQMLKCSDSTLQYYRDTGKLQVRKIGGTYYYSKDSVDTFFSNSN